MKIWTKIKAFFKDLKDNWRASYIPPLMVYFSAGIAGFTSIIETFFVKETLNMSPESLASLGFWVGIPWAMKVPFGQLVDKFWEHKAKLVYLGAGIMAGSIGIMVGLTDASWREAMIRIMSAETWYILSCILAPFGFILQDVVADAMTVEAVPFVPNKSQLDSMHTTMQTLGRVAVVGGSALVAGAGGWLAEVYSYTTMYAWSLLIPIISVSGVIIAKFMKREPRSEGAEGTDKWIWIGSGAFLFTSILFGISNWTWNEEAIFILSAGICGFLMIRIFRSITPEKRTEIFLIALMIFSFRMTPGCGAGLGWWEIDVLGFDESFFGTLSQTSALIAIAGMFSLRSWMARRSIPYLIIYLTVYMTIMFLPFLGMYYGLHIWTEAHLGFGAKTLAIVDTAAISPLSQVAMIPMLAWIAKEAPIQLKATYFAVMAGFSNLALSASQLGTKYVNMVFTVTRGDYSELGTVMILVSIIELVIPVGTVTICQYLLSRSRKAQVHE